MRTLPRRACAAVIVAATFGCGDNTGPRRNTGITFPSGAGVADTVLSLLETPLVIVVRDGDGQPIINAKLQLASTEARDPSFCAYECSPLFPLVTLREANGTDRFTPTLEVRTDDRGQTSVSVWFGRIAGNAGVEVRVAETGQVDTARFVIRPGQPVRALVLPRDTAIYLNTSFHLRGGSADSYGNIVSPGGTYATEPGPIGRTGSLVTGVRYGSARVVLTMGGWSDTMSISVVPRGRIAALTDTYGAGGTLVARDLDGGSLRTFPTLGPYPGPSPGPSWSPDGRQLVISRGDYGDGRLFVHPLDGPQRRLIPSPPPDLVEEIWPSWSHDGRWIYFAGRSPNRSAFALWRSSPDGATVEALATPEACCESQVHPSPSPDGTRVAYTNGSFVRIYDLTTGVTSNIGLNAQSVQWSPDGGFLAFISSDEGYARADGTDARLINPHDGFSDLGISWSPDGEWLLYRGNTWLEIYQLETGTRVRLPYSFHYTNPRWSPR